MRLVSPGCRPLLAAANKYGPFPWCRNKGNGYIPGAAELPGSILSMSHISAGKREHSCPVMGIFRTSVPHPGGVNSE